MTVALETVKEVAERAGERDPTVKAACASTLSEGTRRRGRPGVGLFWAAVVRDLDAAGVEVDELGGHCVLPSMTSSSPSRDMRPKPMLRKTSAASTKKEGSHAAW